MTKFNFLLFIDDDEITNAFHEIIVDTADICDRNLFISDPVEGIDFFKGLANKKEVFPEILFLDINMPKMNGWEFIEALKALNLESLPIIIMLSTSTYERDIQLAASNELVYKYINKPLEENILKALLSELAPILQSQ